MRKPLKDYLPKILLETYEFLLLCNVEQPEMDDYSASIEEVFDSQFITTAPERGIERYEKIFNIVPYDTDTLDERRFRLLSKINAQLPFTVRMLKQQLATLCGENGYVLTINHNQYALDVKVSLTAKRNLDAVSEMLHVVVPANMMISCSLLYNQHKTLANYTHAQLAWYTQFEVRTEPLEVHRCTQYRNLLPFTHGQLTEDSNKSIRKELNDG